MVNDPTNDDGNDDNSSNDISEKSGMIQYSIVEVALQLHFLIATKMIF